MQKSNQLYMCSLLLVSVFITSGCNAAQPNPFNEKFEYFKKPMRNLDPQLMDEVLEYAPDEIKDVIDVINKSGMKESLRVMLVGSPGVGKTTLAQAIALQTGRPCYIVRAPSLSNQFQFSGEQNLIAAINPLFEQKEPCVVIIDEIDALKQKGDKANQDAGPANTLCNLLDDAEGHPHVIFIATTNKLKQIPEDLKSRFGTIVTLPLPDKETRERIIRYHLKELKKADITVDLDEDAIKQLASKTEGFSAREIKAMILKGKIKARKAGDLLQEQQILEAYKAEKPLIGSAWHIKEKLIEFTKEHGVAIALSIVGTAVGAAVGIYGLVQHARSTEHQRQLELKEKQRKLIGDIIAQRKMREDGVVQADLRALLCSVCSEMISKAKLMKIDLPKGSIEFVYYQGKAKYFKQELQSIKKEKFILQSRVTAFISVNDEVLNSFVVPAIWFSGGNPLVLTTYALGKVENWALSKLNVRRNMLSSNSFTTRSENNLSEFMKEYLRERFTLSDQELEELIKKIKNSIESQFDLKIALAEQNTSAYEANSANERSKAAERERRESWVDRFSMGVLTSYVSNYLPGPKKSQDKDRK